MTAANLFFGAWLALIGLAIICTTILAYNNKPGWGWILFIAFIMCLGTKMRHTDDTTPALSVTVESNGAKEATK